MVRFSSFSIKNKHFTNEKLNFATLQFDIYLQTLGNRGLVSPVINNILILTKAMPLA